MSIVLVALLTTGAVDAAPVSYNEIVETRIRPQVAQLLEGLATQGRRYVIDGTAVFSGDDPFLPGKIALGLADILLSVPADDPRRPAYIAEFRRLAALTVDDPNDTWGIYYYVSALEKLRKVGALGAAVDRATLAKLRVRLDWRTFVDVDDFTLIDHPNNYYGVAFAIARLRVLLGWEDAAGSERLLTKMLEHYRQFSGTYGFADETDGEGRFDRYSVLLAAEIAQRFIETGSRPPDEVLGWVRKSADVMLARINPHGDGFEYGRSIGPYGTTAMVEVLTAAAAVHVLNEQEMALAYAYVSRAAQYYADFWLNARTGSLDMWDQGRRTDAYRGKFRILGENLSVAHQFFYTNAAWNELGYRGKPPMPDFERALDRLPKRMVTWFARGEYDRVLLTLRDRDYVIGLPLINGGESQHMHSPYFPIPFAPRLLAGIADGNSPQLVPYFTLGDGSVLAPLAYFQDVKITTRGTTTIVTFRQPRVDKLGGRAPVPDGRITLTSTYTLSPGRITRADVYTPREPLDLKGIAMEFATYAEDGTQKASTVRFAKGPVQEFKATGFDQCLTEALHDNPDYRTPIGPFSSKVSCRIESRTLREPLTLGWSLAYR
jgi:hypothetical protein